MVYSDPLQMLVFADKSSHCDETKSEVKKNKAGMIAGIIIAVIVFLIILAAIIWYLIKRQKSDMGSTITPSGDEDLPPGVKVGDDQRRPSSAPSRPGSSATARPWTSKSKKSISTLTPPRPSEWQNGVRNENDMVEVPITPRDEVPSGRTPRPYHLPPIGKLPPSTHTSL